MPGPILLAIGLVAATAIGKTLFDAFVGETIKGTSYVGKVEMAINTGFLKGITAEALDGLCENEPHPNVGMSSSGLVNIFERFMRAVAQSSIVLPPEISEELFTELIQEGFSNAIQMSVGGSLQSILNVWRGSYPPNPEDIEEIIEEIEDLDLDTLTLLIAQAGANVPTSVWKSVRGFKKYVEKKHEGLKSQAEVSFNKLNTLIGLPYEISESVLSYEISEVLNVIRECYVKAIQLIEEIGERAISRLQELKVELETVLRWIELSEETGQTLVDPDTAINVSIENSSESDVVFETFIEMRDMILNSLRRVVDSSNPSEILPDFISVLERVSLHYNNVITRSVVDVTDEKEKLLSSLRGLRVYRNARDSQSSVRGSIETEYVPPGYGGVTVPSYFILVPTSVSRKLTVEEYDRISIPHVKVVKVTPETYNSLLVPIM